MRIIDIVTFCLKSLHVNQNYRNCDFLARKIKITFVVWTGTHKFVLPVKIFLKVVLGKKCDISGSTSDIELNFACKSQFIVIVTFG